MVRNIPHTLYTFLSTFVNLVLMTVLTVSPFSFFLYCVTIFTPFASGPTTEGGGGSSPMSSSSVSPHRIFVAAILAVTDLGQASDHSRLDEESCKAVPLQLLRCNVREMLLRVTRNQCRCRQLGRSRARWKVAPPGAKPLSQRVCVCYNALLRQGVVITSASCMSSVARRTAGEEV